MIINVWCPDMDAHADDCVQVKSWTEVHGAYHTRWAQRVDTAHHANLKTRLILQIWRRRKSSRKFGDIAHHANLESQLTMQIGRQSSSCKSEDKAHHASLKTQLIMQMWRQSSSCKSGDIAYHANLETQLVMPIWKHLETQRIMQIWRHRSLRKFSIYEDYKLPFSIQTRPRGLLVSSHQY